MPHHYTVEGGIVYQSLRLRHTALLSVFARGEYWLFLLLHLATGFAYREGYIADRYAVNPAYLKVITGITTFFEVFYTNGSYGRYMELYRASKAIPACLMEFVFLLRLMRGPESEQYDRLAMRQALASVAIFFYDLGEVTEGRWTELVERGLLTQQEGQVLMRADRERRPVIALFWAAHALQAGFEKIPAAFLKDMVNHLLKIRELQQEVLDGQQLPLPYPYFHLLRLMVTVNLVLWAYSMALTESLFAPVIYGTLSLIFMGMMEMATELAEPFGEDECDFAVGEWVGRLAQHATVLMEYNDPENLIEATLATQGPLRFERPGLSLFERETSSAPSVASGPEAEEINREPSERALILRSRPDM